jgi:hypothetical protein
LQIGTLAVGHYKGNYVWITSDVDLPQTVLDAQSEGKLVLFVGAGASFDAPSTLPLFDKLACQLADLARVPFDDKVAPDFFLGSLPQGFDTHRHTRDIIARPDSAPNATHHALVRVATSVGQMRIVTTNFDTHLSSAAAAGGIEVSDTWTGPALPLGDDFTGIVHLHGSVLRNPRELVLTDKDFGRAYLTNAWATRFLLQMFQRFTVLFIGYSHDDPIMRYLALGLPSGTPRFAFIKADEIHDSKWSRLGVETIGYPVQDNDHTALLAALQAWDLRSRMGQTEHRARIIEIVAGGPTLTPVDFDYLVTQLKTVNGADEFVQAVAAEESILQIAWLHWAEDRPEFRAMFNGQNGDAATTVLGSWFCQSFLARPELHGVALQTVQRLGQAFGGGLFRAAGWAALELSRVDPDAGRRWKAFLATSVQGHSAPVATERLLPYQPTDRPEDATVLRAALRPYLVLQRRWPFYGSEDPTAIPDAEVHWTTKERSLSKHLVKAVEMTAHGDPTLGSVLEDALSAAYDLLDAYHGPRSWDPLNFRRSAIEPHGQDRHRRPADAVIDALRTYGEKSLEARPDLPRRWWSRDRALFRRLALHLLALDASLTPDEKISWLLEQSVLFNNDLRHEVYSLLKVATGKASKTVLDQLLTAAKSGPDLPEGFSGRDHQYAIYNLLLWMCDVAPEWSEAGTALATARDANPGFRPRDHPDLNKWMESGSRGGNLPMEPEDFIRSFEEDPRAAVDNLLGQDYSGRSFDGPEWYDALALVSRVAEVRPEVGDQFWAFINEGKDLESQAHDLRHAIVEGWAKATLGSDSDAVTARVEAQVTNVESARAVGRFLLEQIRLQIESDDTPALTTMRRTALRLWQEHGQSFTHDEKVDLYSFAPLYLNSWPGDLVQYWMTEVDRRWRKHRDNWSGLNDVECDALTQLLKGPRDALDATQAAVANHLYFVFAADQSFATARVLPLFRDDVTATLVWSSYLHHPRHNDKMLEAGLLDSMIVQWGRLASLEESALQNQFFGLVISVVSFAGITPERRQALLDQSILVDNAAHEAAFAQSVVHFLRDDGVDGAEVWKGWLREHLMARLNGVPRTLGNKALTCWADTVPYLGDGIPEAVELLGDRGIGLGEGFFLPEFPEGAVSTHGRALVSHFAERIGNSASANYVMGLEVNELIEAMQGVLGAEGVQLLVHAAVERGFIRRTTN